MDGAGPNSNIANPGRLHPPLKWAGGKRWLLTRFSKLFPGDFDRLVEPFLGSGAVFFALNPRAAILSDTNSDLIEFFRVLSEDCKSLKELVEGHARLHCPTYYYKVRSEVPSSALKRAARFLYLNRTCWNGLYRVNRKGEFNVPIGTKDTVVLSNDDFEGWSQRLQRAHLVERDFRATISLATKGDFVFVDPPYKLSGGEGFVKYNQNEFSWLDQEELADSVREASSRGAKVLVTNLCAAEVRKLYKGFKIVGVQRTGVIAGDAAFRGNYKEVVIQCWKP